MVDRLLRVEGLIQNSALIRWWCFGLSRGGYLSTFGRELVLQSSVIPYLYIPWAIKRTFSLYQNNLAANDGKRWAILNIQSCIPNSRLI